MCNHFPFFPFYSQPNSRSFQNRTPATTMSSKASFAHHPIHPALVTLPLGLLFTSIISDIIYTFTGTPIVREMAYFLLLAGCIGASVAAIPGLVDYLFIRDDPKEN